jgi:hypothetical protein
VSVTTNRFRPMIFLPVNFLSGGAVSPPIE